MTAIEFLRDKKILDPDKQNDLSFLKMVKKLI